MTLRAVVASLEDIPEAVREEYKEGDDGRFYLQVHGVDEMPAVRGLKQNKTDLLREKKELQEQLDAIGMTPEEIAELKERAESAGDEDVEAVRNELQGKIDSVQKKAKEEIEAAQRKADDAVAAAENYFIESTVNEALSEHEGNPKLLSHVLRDQIKAERVEGDNGRMKFRAVVLGEDGQPRIKSSSGDPFTPSDLAAEFREKPDYAGAFKGTGNVGSGTEPTGGGGPAGSKKVSWGDDRAISENLEDIAAGKVAVTE